MPHLSSRSYPWKGAMLALSLFVAGCFNKHPRPMPDSGVEDQAAQQNVHIAKKSGSRQVMENNIESFKLANGLQIYLIPKPAIPMVTVLIAVKNGSFAENESNNGLAHLYEHMFFKANEKIPSQPDFLKKLEEMGIELGPNMNAYTSTESVRYFFTLQTKYLDEGLGFMADAVISPKFRQDELEKERKVVIGEFDRYEASPFDVFFQKGIFGRLFKEHFVRKNVIGSRPVILAASQQQMHEIQHRYYVPNNSALFIVGEFDDKQTRSGIEKFFSRWKSGDDPFIKYPVPENPPLKHSETFTDFGPVQSVNFVLAFQGPSLTKENSATIGFDLVSLMLSLESSPFQKELVHTGIASHASFFSWAQRYTSPLVFNVETTPENAQKTYEKLMDLVKRMSRGGFFTEQDLNVAKTSTEVSSAYDRESGQKYALNLANVWTSTGSLDYYTSYVEEMKKIKMSQLDHWLKEYFSHPYVLGALMPQGSKPVQFAVGSAENSK